MQHIQEVSAHQAQGAPLPFRLSPRHHADDGHDKGQDGCDDEQDHAGGHIYPENRGQQDRWHKYREHNLREILAHIGVQRFNPLAKHADKLTAPFSPDIRRPQREQVGNKPLAQLRPGATACSVGRHFTAPGQYASRCDDAEQQEQRPPYLAHCPPTEEDSADDTAQAEGLRDDQQRRQGAKQDRRRQGGPHSPYPVHKRFVELHTPP